MSSNAVADDVRAELLDVAEQPLLDQDTGAVLRVHLGDPLLRHPDVHATRSQIGFTGWSFSYSFSGGIRRPSA